MQHVSSQTGDYQWLAALMVTFIALLLINPLGYIGGGWDDWQYLTAAKCWAEHGPCLPRTHWEGRWPVFAPIAALFSVFGVSRFVLGIWPLLCSVWAVAMLVVAGNRLMGRPVGWLAGLIFLVTPAFSTQILEPSVEALELALCLTGLVLTSHWSEFRRPGFAVAAGLAFGIAFQVRETSFVAVAMCAVYAWILKPKFRDFFYAAVGFAAPLLIEFFIYWQWAGDPTLRRALSLAHTQIPSSELQAQTGGRQSPLFNISYIASWRRDPGVQIHWMIDGFLNLFVNGKAGFTLALTPVLLLWIRFNGFADAVTKKAWISYVIGLVYASALIYMLAIDPKPRVMYAPLALVAWAFSSAIINLWHVGRRLLPIVAVTAHAGVGIFGLWAFQRTDVIEGPAAHWIAANPNQIMIDPNTRRHLALVSAADDLPGLNAGRRLLMYNSISPCQTFIKLARFTGRPVTVVEEVRISNFASISPEGSGSFCLLRMAGQSEKEITTAILRARYDGRFLLDRRIYQDLRGKL